MVGCAAWRGVAWRNLDSARSAASRATGKLQSSFKRQTGKLQGKLQGELQASFKPQAGNLQSSHNQGTVRHGVPSTMCTPEQRHGRGGHATVMPVGLVVLIGRGAA